MDSKMSISMNNIFLMLCLLSTAEAILKGKFIIFGDIHFDPSYPTSGTSCHVEIPNEQRLLYGNYECDSSLKLMQSASRKVNEERLAADFVVMAGDLVQHVRNKEDLNETIVLDIVETAARTIRQEIDSSIPILPVLGNHDFYPTSQVPPDTDNQFMVKLSDIFGNIFGLKRSERASFRKGGYYSRLLDGKLLLLVLNTNLYKPSNRATDPKEHPDPADQFAWMEEELREARDKQYKVHILTHIPPGMSESQDVRMLKDEYNNAFNKIILRYADVIMGIQAVHTHTDSFRIYFKGSEPVVPVLLGPSVTPWRRLAPNYPPRNPAVRSVSYKASGNMELIDYTQYYMVLEDANKNKAVWKKEYRFTEAYQKANDASAKSLKAVADSFKPPNSNGFNEYFLRNSVQIQNSSDRTANAVYDCDCACKAVHMCSIIHLDYEEYDRCKMNEISEKCAGCQVKISIGLLFMSFFVVVKTCVKTYA